MLISNNFNWIDERNMALMEMNWRPVNRDLRIFAIVQLVVAAVVAWLLHRRLDWDVGAITVVACSLPVLAVGMAWPQQVRPLFIGWMLAGLPIGWVMSHLLLAVVYFGIITPIGLALRLTGRDPLQLRRRADATTYWSRRPAPSAPENYFRQF